MTDWKGRGLFDKDGYCHDHKERACPSCLVYDLRVSLGGAQGAMEVAEKEAARADAAERALGHLRGSVSGVMTCQRCRHYPCEIPARWCGKCLDAAHAARIAAEQRAERAVAAIERALNETPLHAAATLADALAALKEKP